MTIRRRQFIAEAIDRRPNRRIGGDATNCPASFENTYFSFPIDLSFIQGNYNFRYFKLIVISNAGNAGKGKTLKQNYFIEWLYLLEAIQPTTNNVSLLANKQRSDRMAAPRGFTFRSSQQSTTIGIWIWSRPFLLVDADGTETVVIVLDAQGTNAPGQNGEWDVQIDAQIFTTTSLISSIQVGFFLFALLSHTTARP